MESYPPTIIIRDPREHVKKCSIYPLRHRDDVRMIKYPPYRELCFDGYVRLAPDGPELSEEDVEVGLLLIDASWRWSRKIVRDYLEVPPRSLNGYQSAFPRVSNLGTDPDNGLASVEAIYVAYQILGRPTTGLLDHYRWADEFLQHNGFEQESKPSSH